MFASPAIAAFALAFAALLGLVMGSFVNCWAWRSVHGESVLEGRSRCTSCGHALAWRDLVPVLSWLASKGRCRYCGAQVPARYPLSELACAAAFVVIAATSGSYAEAAELGAFACILLFASLVDTDERVIPDGCVIAALAVRVAYLAAMVATGALGWDSVLFYAGSALGLAGALLAVTLVADRALGRESMGGGDIKLFFVAGLYFGWQQGLLLVLVACVVGISVGIASARAAGEAKAMGRAFPFGPSIALACVVVMAVGDAAVSSYVNLL